MDDAELVRSASGGDKDAFGSIYERYGGRIYNFLVFTMRDPDEAADVLHDTFMLAGARLRQLRDPSKLRPWLYAIARHEALRALKERARHLPFEEEPEVISAEPEPAQAAARDELVQLVWSAAGGLNPRDRVVLDLHLRHGLEGQELGDALGVSASHAYVLLNRLKEQVERSLGALLVTRLGRKECPQLSRILEGWDGRFTPQIRKRVVRHVQDCEQCGKVRRRAVSPVSLLSALPLFPPPEMAKERLMEEVRLVGHMGRPWPARREGFPPPISADGKRRKALGAAAAALLVAGAFLFPATVPALNRLGGFDDGPAGAPAGERARGTPGGALPASAVPPLTIEPVSQNPEGGGGMPSGFPGLPAAPGDDEREPGGGVPAPDRGQAASGEASGPSLFAPPQSEVPNAREAGQSQPGPLTPESSGDTTPPSLGGVAVSPGVIWADGRCGSAQNPRTARVQVAAGDTSGISSVELNWGGPVPGSAAMLESSGAYLATLGPFPMTAVRRGSSVTIPLTATATDTAGNSASSTGSLVLRCA